jgi:hypothetical protein
LLDPERSKNIVTTTSKRIHHATPRGKKAAREPAIGERAIEKYAGPAADEIPIRGYATMLGAFLGAFAGLVVLARRRGVLPRRISLADTLLLGVATHKLTRIVTREQVTIPLRVPFTRYRGRDGAGEVNEEPRGEEIQRAVGSMVTCQYCAGPWVATGLTAGLLFAPRVTRLASGLFAMVAVSDFLHQAYSGAREWSR